MAREEATGKTDAELRKRAWQLAVSIRLGVLTTWNGRRPVARPMDTTIDAAAHTIYFLTDIKGRKIDHLEQSSVANLVFAESGSGRFVSFNGRASVSNNRKKIREIWTETSKAWWDSADDPAIRLVTFKPRDVEIWDSPNTLVATVKMLTAAVTGVKPKLGDHAVVTA